MTNTATPFHQNLLMPVHESVTHGSTRLAALDIDGTILGHDGSLDAQVKEAVSAAVDAGVHVVLATGRSLTALLPIVEMLELPTGYAVASNGSVTIHTTETGYKFEEVITFDPAPALTLLREHAPDVLFAVEDLGRGFKVTDRFPDGELTGWQEVVSFEELISTPATRVTLRAPEWTAKEFHELVIRSNLSGVAYSVGWSAWLDLNPAQVSKASALEKIRTSLGVSPAGTVAVGDGRNDIEMLRWAGLGVAMGDADSTTRAAADALTGGVRDNGLVPVLQALVGAI